MDSLFESLEARKLMALFTVTNLNDAGAGSLRQAIDDANASIGVHDTIEFDGALQSGTVVLGSRLTISDDLTISGLGRSLFTISGNNATGVFDIAASTSVFISDLTIADGADAVAGGIVNAGNLTLARAGLKGNSTPAGQAGAIFNSGTLSMSDCFFENNSTVDGGAGAIASTGTLTIAPGFDGATFFTGNSATNAGAGALLVAAGTADITNATFTGNSSGTGSGGAVVNNAIANFLRPNFSGNTAGVNGGAILNTATMTIDDGEIYENSAASGGGAISTSGALTIDNTRFHANHAVHGGAISNAGTLTIADSDIRDNFISGDGAPGDGGAIYNAAAAELVIADTWVMSNHATRGGGIFAADGPGSVTITGSRLSFNTAESDGGAIYAGSSLSVTATQLEANHAVRGGGVFRGVDGGTLNISASTLWVNIATGEGGAIFIAGLNTLNLVNSTLSQNIANNLGAGLFVAAGAAANVDNSTIAFNRAGAAGGGVWNEGTARLRSTIVARNTIDNTQTASDVLGPASLDAASSFNLIGDADTAGGLTDGVDGNIVGADPMLAPLLGGGGPTPTHALLAGSPALNAGSNTLDLEFDQRGDGFARVFHAQTDIGAVEMFFSPTLTLTATPESVLYGSDQDITLNAEASDPDGTIVRVDFYYDANGDNELTEDELLGSDSDGADGYQFVYTGTESLPRGQDARFYGVATDDDGFTTTTLRLVPVTNNPPSFDTLTPSETTFAQGDALTLTAEGFLDPDGSVTGVRFYVDLDGDGVADDNELLGVDLDGSDGFTYTLTTAQSNALATGDVSFLAVAVDNDGALSNPVAAAANVLFSLRSGEFQVVGAADGANAPYVAMINVNGDLIVFEDEWTATNVTAVTGAPKAISSATIWRSSFDGLVYAAAPTAEGLILFRRSTEGTWTIRNLTIETQGENATRIPTHGLTTMLSTGGMTVIAGITAEGDIIGYQQINGTVGPPFWFIDISADLESQGMSTPQLDSLISYVPSWDAWHLAGIDADGQIQSVWINWYVDGFTKWRVDNLSSITGAPVLSGQLTVTLTPWGGINLTGLNAAGELLTTWWVPQFGGDWAVSNLTEQFQGPTFTGGNVSGYTTPWGGINYVGIDADGDVTVYWWTPAMPSWLASPLLPPSVPSENIPTGELTSSSSSAGTLNVYGSTATGEVIRMSWEPDSTAWTAENLTDLAERA